MAKELTHTKAALILGVKPSSVEPLLGGKVTGCPGVRQEVSKSPCSA